MSGKLLGVGVGPGDPELLTLKAYRVINEADVIIVPGEEVKESIAYKIVKDILEKNPGKEIEAVSMPMTKDNNVLEESHKRAADTIISHLDKDKKVAFLTLGDPTVYSTYIYVHKLVDLKGYDTEIINGITSFVAASARLNIGLVEKSEILHIIPSSYQIEDALKLPGTKVLMKSGKKLPKIKEKLREMNAKVMMVENCGMDGEKIYKSADDINENAGYYSLIIVKEN